MGFSLCILILVIGHAVVSAIAFGISGYFSYTAITQFANNTRYGVLELPEELRQASSIVETLVFWGFVQTPGLILLCKGRILRGMSFLFALACEILFLVIPIITEVAYVMAQTDNPTVLTVANLLYAEFAFMVLTLLIAVAETFTLCCCGNSD